MGDSPEERLRQRNGEADALTGLGVAYGSLSQPDQAIQYLQQSVQVTESIRAQIPAVSQAAYLQSVAPRYRLLAELLQKQGRSTEAQAVLKLLGN
ncbi:MAG: hypothetical protein ACRC8A_04165 [Microcoleaceae cyanobacterium]